MERPEPPLQTFVIRIWLEERADETKPAIWRGAIMHVLSGEKLYISNLGQISDFIAAYLEQMGVEIQQRSWLSRWTRRARRR